MEQERVHYRRYTPSRLSQPETNNLRKKNQLQREEGSGFRDKLIVQGIISAVILAVVLVMGLVDHPRAESVRTNLASAISDQTTPDQVVVEVRRLLSLDDDIYPAYSEYAEPAIRIDEDLLRELLDWTAEEDLKSIAPEPTAQPEL